MVGYRAGLLTCWVPVPSPPPPSHTSHAGPGNRTLSKMSVYPTQLRGNALLVREEKRERRKRSLSTQRWRTFRPSGALGSQESRGPGSAERSKERRPAVRSSAWGLETFSVLHAVPFLSPFFSVPFSLASSPSSSKIQIGIVESLVDHLVLRLCFLGVTGFFTGRTGAGCFETVESNLWVFSSSEYWGLECNAEITCFLFGSRFFS